MRALESLDWQKVRAHYDQRLEIRRRLRHYRKSRQIERFNRLLLGISDRAANYSASDHSFGPRILGENADSGRRIYRLATKLRAVTSGDEVPPLIQEAALHFLKIGVGSEASCILNPKVCWVVNTRTIWTHLVRKHNSIKKANEELDLYRGGNDASEMAYFRWIECLHPELEASMRAIAGEGAELATDAGVKPGKITFLWADAIANALYEQHH